MSLLSCLTVEPLQERSSTSVSGSTRLRSISYEGGGPQENLGAYSKVINPVVTTITNNNEGGES